MSDTLMKFKNMIGDDSISANFSTQSGGFNGDGLTNGYVGDVINPWSVNPLHYNDPYNHNSMSPIWVTKQQPQITINDVATDINYNDDNLIHISTKKEVNNKVDKDLVDGKLPYNIKKDIYGNLFYEFACSGYRSDDINLSITKDGIVILLNEVQQRDDDLVGEEFEFLCKGIKTSEQKELIFIDSDQYDLENYSAELDCGILQIKIPKKMTKKIIKKQIKDNNKKQKLI